MCNGFLFQFLKNVGSYRKSNNHNQPTNTQNLPTPLLKLPLNECLEALWMDSTMQTVLSNPVLPQKGLYGTIKAKRRKLLPGHPGGTHAHAAAAQVVWPQFSTNAAPCSQCCCTCPRHALPLPGVVCSFFHSQVKTTLVFSSCSTATWTSAGVLGSFHIAGQCSWIYLLAASYGGFSLVPLTLLLLSFLSFLKPSWQHYCSGLCLLVVGLSTLFPRRSLCPKMQVK